MSKLQELIQRLCPDGVEYKKLGEVLEYEQPTKYIVKSTEYDDSYSIPVLTAGQSFILGYTNEQKDVFDASKDNPVIIFDDFTTSFHWVDFPFKIKSSAMKMLRPKDNSINFKYIHYAMQCICFVPGEHTRYRISKYSMFTIPVPPLEVQEEIVRILDRFAVYAAELQAELQARKEQYEYYRNLLLTFNPTGCAGGADDEQEGGVTSWGGHSYPIQWKTMGEVFEMSAGKAIPADNIKSQMNEENSIKCYGANGLRGYVNFSSHIGPNVIIGRQGALCGNITYATGKFYATDHAVVVSSSKLFHSRYIFHMLTHANLNQYKTAGAQPGLSVSRLERVPIPIPPLELQEKIVAVLDRFETLVNDLSEGLPAEIAAVREQYEYYRNRLLTFKEKTA